MKTFHGKDIPDNIRAIVYLCDLKEDSIEVIREVMFTSNFEALEFYANTPNPESQLVMSNSPEELRSFLTTQHARMRNKEWCKRQHDFI